MTTLTPAECEEITEGAIEDCKAFFRFARKNGGEKPNMLAGVTLRVIGDYRSMFMYARKERLALEARVAVLEAAGRGTKARVRIPVGRR